ncbi:MAG: GNAT family N-acetyltransferase [Candidatus Eremiobacteraeota bacterium]|nr:GNAT family N-acetyltransferase [Candidatus Eremiobacteraeota bacterium]
MASDRAGRRHDVAALDQHLAGARVHFFSRFPLSLEQEREWAANAAVNPNTPCYIIETPAGVDIGIVGLHVEGARAALGIAIHEPRYWARGLGTDAVRTLVDGAFRVRPLIRIELTVFPENARAIRCYERAGFAREGILRRYVYKEGTYRDVLMMSVLHEEWLAGRPRAKRATSRQKSPDRPPR